MRKTVTALRTEQRSPGRDEDLKPPRSTTSKLLGARWQSIAHQFRTLYETLLDHGSGGSAGSLDQGDAGIPTSRCDSEAPRASPEQAQAGTDEFIPQAGTRARDQVQADLVPLALAPGLRLDGRYLIEKELDRGGFSVVFLARGRKLQDTPLVIKVLQEQAMEGDSRACLPG